MLDQVGIGCLGVTSLWMVQSKSRKQHFAGSLIGLAAQPFWFYTTFTHEQWGIFAMSFFYTAAWIRGVHNYWPKPPGC